MDFAYNKYRKGYKYNLPRGLEVYNNLEYNLLNVNKYNPFNDL